jgi:hypothetical protein
MRLISLGEKSLISGVYRLSSLFYPGYDTRVCKARYQCVVMARFQRT